MSRFNLKNNPELAKERHREQNREWYQRNKEYVMDKQRKYRAKKKKEKEAHKFYIECATAFNDAFIKSLKEEAKVIQMFHEAAMKDLERKEALKRQKRAEYQRQYRKRIKNGI